jgi:hypothetical protein
VTDVGATSRALRWAGWGAAVLAALSSLVSAYWATGGTALLSTVGGDIERLGREGGTAVVLVLAATALAKAVGAALALALVRPPRRLPVRALEAIALVGGASLALYGGVLTALGAVAATGVLGPPAALSPAASRRSAGRARGPAR